MIKREELLEEIEKLRGLKNCGERVIQKREEQLKRISAELEIKELCLSILDKQKGVLHPDNFFKQDSNKEFLVRELSTNRIGFIRNLSTACENRLWLNEYCVFVDGPEAHDMLNDFKLASGWYNGKEYKDGLEVVEDDGLLY